jgi:hypothetical protein
VSSAARRWHEALDVRHRRRACLRRLLAAASTYEQWRDVAEQLYSLDIVGGPAGSGTAGRATRLYDAKLLAEKRAFVAGVRATGNVKELMLALRTDLIRNVANIAKRCGWAARRGALGAAHHLGMHPCRPCLRLHPRIPPGPALPARVPCTRTQMPRVRCVWPCARSQLHEHFVLVPEDIAAYLAEVRSELAELVEWPEVRGGQGAFR